MPNTYNVGETIKVTGTFKENGELGDPAVVRVLYKDPETDIVTTITYPDDRITKVSTGVYSFKLHLTKPGFWYYKMDDGGTNVSAEDFCQASISNCG